MEEFEPYLQLVNTVCIFILGIAFYSQNKIVSSIKDFMSIFDTKKVKEYAEMREETIMAKAEKFVADDEKIWKIVREGLTLKVDEISEHYKEIMGKEHTELFLSTVYLLQNCLKNKKDDQIRFIDEFLPNNKTKIMPYLFPEDYDSNTP
ncbi:hypothetical protein D2V93_15920 [Flagellimonas taeanensis]|uniref:hypothetical protein n=1 Tax=Flavobacteriaceae TaxID=49546 RepID=UPI000E67CC4A|nr:MULTISPECIES: hypothetical protein [Allomuricauda]MDC6383879.1 hypothetical protein [Muricauda sp. SK9]RIV48497.1 hypothetical protein D2V93_15920 [Allomuricauda taeanensis]